MKIVLYQSKQDERTLDKVLSDGLELQGTLKAGASIIRPVVIIRGEPQGLAKYNYAEIEAFGRFYFIRNQTVITNSLSEIELSVDVLKTYAQSIRACAGRVSKSATPEEYKLQKVLKDTNSVKHISFENPFNFKGVNVMVCVNGNNEIEE